MTNPPDPPPEASVQASGDGAAPPRDAGLNVLFVSQYFHPEPFSNTGLAAELARRGHQVVAIPCVPNYPAGTFYPGYSNRTRREEEFEGISIRRAWTKARGKSKPGLLLNYLVYPVTALYTAMRMKRFVPDVSFVSMPSPLTQAFVGAMLKRWRGIPTVYWVQDLWPETIQQIFRLPEGLRLRLLTAACRWLYRQADIVLVQSEAMQDRIAAHGIPRDRIRVLPNTAPAHFLPAAKDPALTSRFQVDDEAFTVMFAGNIGESQGLEILAEALPLVSSPRPVEVVLVGSGRGEEALKAQVEALGLTDRVHFWGRHPEQAMPSLYALADALFLSLRDLPTFTLTVPYKLQTYMACGKPILASLSGEGRRIIEQAGAGLVASTMDARGLAKAIEEMMSLDAEQRAAMGERARQYYVQHYSNDVVHGILEDALSEAARR